MRYTTYDVRREVLTQASTTQYLAPWRNGLSPISLSSLRVRRTEDREQGGGGGLLRGLPKKVPVLCPRSKFISSCCWADKARWLMDLSFASSSSAHPGVPVVHLGVSSNHLHHVLLTAAPAPTRDLLFKTTSSHISHLALCLHTPHTTNAPTHTPSSFPLT
jgi:hypothetical protein